MEQGWLGRATAEFIGTFGLVFFGAGSIVVDHHLGTDGYGLIGTALAHALVLAIVVTAAMRVSGGHINPGISIAAFLTRKLSATRTLVYVGAQLLGGLAGATFVRALLPLASGEATAFGATTVAASISPLKAVTLELVLTFFLVLAYWATVASRKAPNVGGFAVGLTLLFAMLVGAPLTGASLNPARTLGPAIIAGEWSMHWIYWVGPILGASLAAAVHEGLVEDEASDLDPQDGQRGPG